MFGLLLLSVPTLAVIPGYVHCLGFSSGGPRRSPAKGGRLGAGGGCTLVWAGYGLLAPLVTPTLRLESLANDWDGARKAHCCASCLHGLLKRILGLLCALAVEMIIHFLEAFAEDAVEEVRFRFTFFSLEGVEISTLLAAFLARGHPWVAQAAERLEWYSDELPVVRDLKGVLFGNIEECAELRFDDGGEEWPQVGCGHSEDGEERDEGRRYRVYYDLLPW
jgi:hypothetical protein